MDKKPDDIDPLKKWNIEPEKETEKGDPMAEPWDIPGRTGKEPKKENPIGKPWDMGPKEEPKKGDPLEGWEGFPISAPKSSSEEIKKNKETPRCPYCKGELLGHKKKCPICHRNLPKTSTSNKKNSPNKEEKAGEEEMKERNRIADAIEHAIENSETKPSEILEQKPTPEVLPKSKPNIGKSGIEKISDSDMEKIKNLYDNETDVIVIRSDGKIEKDWGIAHIDKKNNKVVLIKKGKEGIIKKIPIKEFLEWQETENHEVAEDEKVEIIAMLQEKIANSERIIKANEKREEEILARLAELGEEIKKEEEEKTGIKRFSATFIKERILSLLQKVKEIEINSLNIKGVGEEIILNTKIKSSGFNIGVEATLENKGAEIAVKKYNIDASWIAKGTAEKKLVPYLDQISELLKSYIEKEEGKKVKKISIENGELKVTF